MILSAVYICYDPIHQPLAAEGAVKIQNLNSERPASKIIRAVLRDSDIDPEDAVNYSLHRCHCNSNTKDEDQTHEAFKSELTLDQLGIRGGNSVFIRKIEVGEEVEEHQDKISPSLSRKRKERDEDEATFQSSLLPSAPAPKSNLENLESPQAAATARSISKLLGGEGWKTQSIGKLGLIKTKSCHGLSALLAAIKTSLQIPQVAQPEAGFFNSDLVEALIRAYQQRVSNPRKHGENHFADRLIVPDYERAGEILSGKVNQAGSWRRISISHLDDSAVSKPISRFPLIDRRLSGSRFAAATAICVLWNNDKWIAQAPLPGLSPISLKDDTRIAVLRQTAELTRGKPGEAAPDGYPPIVLQAIRKSIRKNEKAFKLNKGGSQASWAQTRCIQDAFALLKERVVLSVESASSSTAAGSSKAGGSNEVENKDFDAKRRKIECES